MRVTSLAWLQSWAVPEGVSIGASKLSQGTCSLLRHPWGRLGALLTVEGLCPRTGSLGADPVEPGILDHQSGHLPDSLLSSWCFLLLPPPFPLPTSFPLSLLLRVTRAVKVWEEVTLGFLSLLCVWGGVILLGGGVC